MRLRRRKGRHPEDPTARARSEARAAARSKRAAARARARAERREELGLRVRGLGLETRRRLRPAGRAFGPLGSWLRARIGGIAPHLSRFLLLLISVPAALIALLLRLGQSGLGSLRERLVTAAAVTATVLSTRVRPRRMRPVVAAREARP
jgi:hypothetical protein